jgi:hypothetical protein
MRKSLGVVKPEHPSLVRVILIEQAETHILSVVAAAPRLEGHGLFQTGLLIQIVTVKDQRFIFGIKKSAKRLVCLPSLRDVVDIRDVKVSRPNQVSNLPVVREELFVEREHSVLLFKGGICIAQSGFKGACSCSLLGRHRTDSCSLVTK